MERFGIFITILYFFLCSFLVGATCSKAKVTDEVKSLQSLKTECDNLDIELESLGAKKWTKVIDDKVKACKDHGFWPERKSQVKNFMEEL